MIGGIIAGYALEWAISDVIFPGSSELYVVSIPKNVGVGKATNVTFLAFGNGEMVSNASITLVGAASGGGTTDPEGMLELTVNASSNGLINVTAMKDNFKNGTSEIIATPGLFVSASPASITSGTPTYVTFSVNSIGSPVSGASLNLSGAGIAIDGMTNSNGEIVMQVNAPNTGSVNVMARKSGYAEGSNTITSTSQQTLSVTSSQTAITVNVPAYVTFTVTAGDSAVSDAVVTLTGTASGSGITNQDGKAIIVVTPTSAGTITASAGKNGYAGGSIAITSTGTQSLSITGSPSSVIAGVPSYVSFSVMSGNNAISDAMVTLTGAASGSGITNQNGQVILLVNSTASGTITTSAAKTGYSAGSATINAVGQQTLSLSTSPVNVTDGVPAYVIFTVTSGGSVISGASVSIKGGGISTDGVTNSAGQVTLLLNSAGTGTISVTARKTGYIDGLATIAH